MRMNAEEIENEVNWTSATANIMVKHNMIERRQPEDLNQLAEELSNGVVRLGVETGSELAVHIDVGVVVPMILSKLRLPPAVSDEVLRLIKEKLRTKLPELQEPDRDTQRDIEAICATYLVRLGEASRATAPRAT